MTYRNHTEAENLRLKAELEKTQSELAELKSKYAPKPKKVEPVLVPEQSDKDRARYELESLLVPLKGYYPPNSTNRSFLDEFRKPSDLVKIGCCAAIGISFGLLVFEWILLFTL